MTVYLDLLVLLQMLLTSVLGRRKVASSVVIGNQALTQDVARLLEQGVIWPVIAARFPLARIADAHHELETVGRPAGAVVVSVHEEPRTMETTDPDGQPSSGSGSGDASLPSTRQWQPVPVVAMPLARSPQRASAG